MIGILTPQQVRLLRLLSRTGFATNKHLEQMQINKVKNSNYHITKTLLDRGYMGRVLVSSGWGVGRKVMYYITKKGAETISEIDGVALEELAYTHYTGGIKKAHIDGETALIRSDFIHKERYITAFLFLEKYLLNTDYLIGDFYHYYQLKGDKGTALTVNGKNFRPDGVIFCEPVKPKLNTFAYVIELHRHSDRRRIIKQLLQHVEAIKQHSLQNRFNIQYPYFVLSIFSDENLGVMKSILEELQTLQEWEYIKNFFMFARLNDLENDFYKACVYFGGNKKPLPPKL